MNYTEAELNALGLRFGHNVNVHRSVEFFGADRITIGSNVRIDCFCVLSAGEPITIGHNVHLAAGVSIFGSAGAEIADFCGLSCRTTIFTTCDDYHDGHLTNPMVPNRFRRVQSGRVVLRQHAIVGAGAVILPGVTLHRGVAVGALSLVNKSVPEYLIVAGNPIRKIGVRDHERLNRLEREFHLSTVPQT